MCLPKPLKLLAILLLFNTITRSQSVNIFVTPAMLQVVGDTTTVNVWMPAATSSTSVYAWAWNDNSLTNVTKTLTYDSVSGYYTGRFPFTGFPNDTIILSISGSSGVRGRVSIIHDASLILPPGNDPQIQLEKPLAYSVADPLLPVKGKVLADADSARLLITVFTFTPFSYGDYNLLSTELDSTDTVLDLSAYYGRNAWLLVQAIDRNNKVVALRPFPIYVESSPYLERIFTANGRILDFNYGKVLVIDNGPASNPRIVDITTGISVPIPFNGIVSNGYLTGHGALITSGTSSSLDSLYDFNDGSLFTVGVYLQGSLSVAGNYCIWNTGKNTNYGTCPYTCDSLFLRNMADKTNNLVSFANARLLNGRPSVSSLNEDGSVVYIDSVSGLLKYSNGLYTLLSEGSCISPILNPLHDGDSRIITITNGPTTALDWNKHFILSDPIVRDRRPLLDYQVKGRYCAYIHVPIPNQGSSQVRLADTSGNDILVSNSGSLEILNQLGELMFLADKRKIAFPGGGVNDLCSMLGKAYYRNAGWFVAIGNTLYRINFNAPQDTITGDTIAVGKDSLYQFTKHRFTGHFGPSSLFAIRITALPHHGTLMKAGIPVILNEEVSRADLDKLTFQPEPGYTGVDSLLWAGSNSIYYTTTSARISIMIVAPPPQPVISGLLTSYCSNAGIRQVKVTNWSAGIPLTAVSALLDATPLTLNTADTSFSFSLNGLSAGTHTLTVRFTNIAGSRDTVSVFTVVESVTPNVDLSANITHVVNLTDNVVVTAANVAGGGSAPLYTFAKDRSFSNVLQAEGTINTLTINPANLVIGDNWIYARLKTSAVCYTSQTNTDSILLKRDAATGIVDPNNPGQVIAIAPNPFDSYVNVSGFNNGRKYLVVLYNARGQVIKTVQINNRSRIEIPVNGLKPGAYWLSIYDSKHKLIGTEKLIKN